MREALVYNFTMVTTLHGFCRCTENCALYKVTRSTAIESEGDYQKNKKRIQELKALWNKERLHCTMNQYIETFDINTITSFYFTNSHFLDPRFCVDHHFLYILPPSSHERGFFRGKNFIYQSRTCNTTSDFFPLTEFLEVVTEDRECGLFPL